MRDKDRDELDSIIDSALAGYSGVEPLSGLEERVLGRIEAAVRPRRRWGWWAVAAALASLVVGGSFLWRGGERLVVKAPERSLTVAARNGDVVSEVRSVPARVPPRQARVPALRSPRLAQFPTPSPLTPEELALLALAKMYPEEARSTAAWLEKGAPQEIVIEEIQITPLETGGDQ